MITIRHVRPWEEEMALPLCQMFHAETGFGSTFSPDRVRALLIGHKSVIIGAFTIEGLLVGILIGFLAEQLLTEALIAQEILWYIHPDHRGAAPSAEMLESFELWAHKNKANAIAVASLTKGSPSVPRFYQAKGYAEIETHHLKLI